VLTRRLTIYDLLAAPNVGKGRGIYFGR